MALVAGILAVPAWMLADDLRDFVLILDDFVYVSEARDWPTARAHLLEPHNTHVVPIFRLWTYALIALAGRLEYLPAVLAAASYLALIAAMVAVGYLVAKETGRPAAGLGAMAVLGISTVSHPAATWYSASQALWAGAATVLTVALARGWAAKGGTVRLAAVGLGAIAAPAIWSGGLIAGPAAIAYLAARGTPRFRRPALLLAGVTVAAAAIIVGASSRHLLENSTFWQRHPDAWARPVQAVLNTAQALVETGCFANLGVEAKIAPGQAAALLAALVVVHAGSRIAPGRFSPLEAAGATIAIGCGLMDGGQRGHC